MKRIPLLLWTTLLALPGAHADIAFHLRLEEGVADPNATTVASEVLPFTGTFGRSGSAAPARWTADVPPVAGAGSETAVVFSDSASVGGGSSRIVTTYMGIPGAAARTVAAWVRVAPTQTNFAGIVSYGANSPNGSRFTLRINETAAGVRGALRLEIAGNFTIASRDLRDNQWHHVAVAWDQAYGAYPSNAVIYIDGVIDPKSGSGTANVPINTITNGTVPVTIGSSSHSVANYGLNGAVDDVQIHDEALDQSAILAMVYGTRAPEILSQPASRQVILGQTGGTVVLSVGAGGTPPLRYQWFKDNDPIPAATGSALTIPTFSAADLGTYRVSVSNDYGGLLSVPATISWGTAPVHPAHQAVLLGKTATFTVPMPEGPAYGYQWRTNGVAVTGATTPVLTLPVTGNATVDVEVTLDGSSATSGTADLVAVVPPGSTYARIILADGPEAYWRLGELTGTTATDLTTFHPGNYLRSPTLGAAGAIPGDSDSAVSLASATLSFVEVPPSAQLNNSNAFTLEAWVQWAGGNAAQAILTGRNRLPSAGYTLYKNSANRWQFETGDATSGPSVEKWESISGGAATNEWTHIVATFDNGQKRLYENGVEVASGSGIYVPVNVFPTRIGAGLSESVVPGLYWNGGLDEVAIYRYALSPAQIELHYRTARAPRLTIVPDGLGGAFIHWTGPGVLQQSDDPAAGVWEDAPESGESPYPIIFSDGQRRFYRLRVAE